MRIRMKIAIVCWAACSVFLSAGCGRKDEETAKNDLLQIQLMFHNYHDTFGKSPSSIEDTEKDFPMGPGVYQRLKEGRYQVYWGTTVRILDNAKEDQRIAKRILAYEKDVPTKGGWVVLIGLLNPDRGIKPMTAEEFQAAPKGNEK